MPLTVNPGATTFTDIQNNADNFTKGKAIRGRATDGGAMELYNHGAKLHGDNKLVNNPLANALAKRGIGKSLGLGKANVQIKVAARHVKEKQGADLIKQAINNEYGSGFSDRVFSNINRNHESPLGDKISKGDLQLIQNAIGDLQAADVNARQQIYAHGKGELKADGASALLSVATNPDVSSALREEAMGALRSKLLELPSDKLAGVMTEIDKGNKDFFQNIVEARSTSGGRIFSVDDLSKIGQSLLKEQIPREDKRAFLQNESPAAKFISQTLKSLDDGRIPALGADIKSVISEECSRSGHEMVSVTSLNGGRPTDLTNAPHPNSINRIASSIDGALYQGPTPELKKFASTINDSIMQAGYGKDDARKMTAAMVISRGVAPAIEEQDGHSLSNLNVQNLGVFVEYTIKSLQQAATGQGFTDVLPNNAHFQHYNNGIDYLLRPGSGYNLLMEHLL